MTTIAIMLTMMPDSGEAETSPVCSRSIARIRMARALASRVMSRRMTIAAAASR